MHTQKLFSFLLPITTTFAQTTLIPTSCFASQSSLEQYFNYAYPWGNTHNGAALMLKNQSVINPPGTLTLISEYTGPQASDSTLHYNSGTVYAKQQFPLVAGGGYDFSASFIAPVAKGTWPAFWLTATKGWPPEIDMAEWKGDGKISFNTFNTSSDVAADDVNYASPTSAHGIKCEIRDVNGEDASAAFYMDGKLQTTQFGAGYIGQSMWLIIDSQMEGSSGSPGPTTSKFLLTQV